MDKSDPPQAFGVFNPVGHTVIAFRSAADVQAARGSMLDQGFDAAALVTYTPAEMVAQVDADLQSATPMASLGQGLNLVKAHRDLAQSGCSFLVVQTPDERLTEMAVNVARTQRAVSAQRYGWLIVEEMLEEPGSPQVFESPARGLDIEAPAAENR